MLSSFTRGPSYYPHAYTHVVATPSAARLTPLSLPHARQGLIRFEGEFYAEGCHAVSSIDEYRVAKGGNGAGIYNGNFGQVVFKEAVEMHFCGDWVSTHMRDNHHTYARLVQLRLIVFFYARTPCGILVLRIGAVASG